MHFVFDAPTAGVKSLRELAVNRLRFVVRALFALASWAWAHYRAPQSAHRGTDRHGDIQLNLLPNGTVEVVARRTPYPSIRSLLSGTR